MVKKIFRCLILFMFLQVVSYPVMANEKIMDICQGDTLYKEDYSMKYDGALSPNPKLNSGNFSSDVTNKISVDLLSMLNLGFSDLLTSEAAPKATFSWGVDVVLQLKVKERIKFIPENFFSEATAGLIKRGCSAFHMYYYNLRLYPLGYTYSIKDWDINAKVGLYTAIPFSKVETNINSFKSNMDLGLTLGVGTEYRNIGVNLLYELGFIKICKSKLSMINSSFLVNVSYRLISLF